MTDYGLTTAHSQAFRADAAHSPWTRLTTRLSRAWTTQRSLHERAASRRRAWGATAYGSGSLGIHDADARRVSGELSAVWDRT